MVHVGAWIPSVFVRSRNPWCYVFNWWGQGICGDGTGAQHHWDTLLSGPQFPGRRGVDPVFDNQHMRPAVGSEFLYSRQFPDNVQGQFIYACVINMNGIPRFEIHDDGGGYNGLEMGYAYAALGSKVTVVELTEGLLAGVDRDLVQPLHKRLETLFDKIYLRTKVVKGAPRYEYHRTYRHNEPLDCLVYAKAIGQAVPKVAITPATPGPSIKELAAKLNAAHNS